MRIKLGIIAAITLSVLCVAAQEKKLAGVKSNYDKNYNFSQIKTFYVKIATPWGNPTNEQHAKEAVIRELTAKGWTEAPDESSADALVLIHGATETRHTLKNFYAGGYGGYDWGGQAVVATQKLPFKAGSAVIDIFDNKTKKLIFRGTGEGEISQKGAENREKIDKGVKEIFEDFPPKSGG
jgi:hypothetical protein